MRLDFTNMRRPESVAELDDALRAQAVAAGRSLDGEDLPAEVRIVPFDLQDEPALYQPEVWDVVDEAGRVLYQAWFYQVDSGLLFRHGTNEVVGEILQGGLDSRNPLASALRDAQRRYAGTVTDCAMAGVCFG